MIIAVCEDEKIFLQIIRNKILDYVRQKDIDAEIKLFLSGAAFTKCEEHFDIVFMDIDLGKENGMDIISAYRKNHKSINIILTSHTEEIANGYKVRAFRFLSKPIQDQAFFEALDEAILLLGKSRRYIGWCDGEEKVIHEEEIIYVEAGDKYSGIRISEGFYRVKYTITEMKQQLDTLDFYMPHRSYIVNMNYIDKIEEEKIYLINREKIKISRLKKKDFRMKFFDFIRRKSVYGN